MLDIGLILWSSLLVLTAFSGYMMMDMGLGDTALLLPMAMMFIGLFCLWGANQNYKKAKQATVILQKGYEKYLFFGSYLLLFSIHMGIITGGYTNLSMVSPFVMLTWLSPMVTYTVYQNIWFCYEEQILILWQQSKQKIPYHKIHNINIKKLKNNKVEIILTTKTERYVYTTKESYAIVLQNYLVTKNVKIKNH